MILKIVNSITIMKKSNKLTFIVTVIFLSIGGIFFLENVAACESCRLMLNAPIEPVTTQESTPGAVEEITGGFTKLKNLFFALVEFVLAGKPA